MYLARRSIVGSRTQQSAYHRQPRSNISCNSNSNQKSVVITGCSSGIGRALTQHLHEQGWIVFAGVRKEQDVASVASIGDSVVPLLLDVTNAEQVADAQQKVRDIVGDAGLTAVINNAAYALWSPAECVKPEDFQRILDVNVTGALRVSQSFLPMLRQSANSRIVNISSVAGTIPLPHWSTYNAAKFALEALTDCIRMELRDQGICVVLVKPPPVKTPIWANGQRYTDEAMQEEHPQMHLYQDQFQQVLDATRKFEEDAIEMQPVLDTIMTALTHPNPRARYMVARSAEVLVFLRRLLPDRFWDWLLLRAFSSK